MSAFSSRFHPPPPPPSCPCQLCQAAFLLGRLCLVRLDNRCPRAQVREDKLEGRHHRHPPVARSSLSLRIPMRCHLQLHPTIRHPQKTELRFHNVGGTTKTTLRVCLLRPRMARQTLADALLRLLRQAAPRHRSTSFRYRTTTVALAETARMRLASKVLDPVAS